MSDVTGGKKVTAVNQEAAIGATVRYTVDGTDPVSTSTEWPTAGLTFNAAGTTVVKAASFKGTESSSVASKTVTVAKLTAPTVTPGMNAFTISGNAEEGADLYYRLGTSGSWSKYTAEVAITETVTVQAYAKKAGSVDSDQTTQQVEFTPAE